MTPPRWGKKAGGEDLFKRIAKDLFRLEINVIVKPDMTARSIPPTPLAALDVARKYYWFLKDLNEIHQVPGVSDLLEDWVPEKRTNGPEVFAAFRGIANLLLERIGWTSPSVGSAGVQPKRDDPHAGERVVLERVHRTSSVLSALIEAEKARSGQEGIWGRTREELYLNLQLVRDSTPDLATVNVIQKAWEIGTEQVATQSVLYLDGDVVTRVNPDFLGEEYSSLRQLHLDACRLSVETWERIASLIASMISGALKTLAEVLSGPGGGEVKS